MRPNRISHILSSTRILSWSRRHFSKKEVESFSSNRDQFGFDLVKQRTYNILNNFTENTLAKVLHVNCGGNFVSYFGESTNFSIHGCTSNKLLADQSRNMIQYHGVELIKPGGLQYADIRPSTFQFVVSLQPLLNQTQIDHQVFNPIDPSLSPSEYINLLTSFAAPRGRLLFGFPESTFQSYSLYELFLELDKSGESFELISMQMISCEERDLKEESWEKEGEREIRRQWEEREDEERKEREKKSGKKSSSPCSSGKEKETKGEIAKAVESTGSTSGGTGSRSGLSSFNSSIKRTDKTYMQRQLALERENKRKEMEAFFQGEGQESGDEDEDEDEEDEEEKTRVKVVGADPSLSNLVKAGTRVTFITSKPVQSSLSPSDSPIPISAPDESDEEASPTLLTDSPNTQIESPTLEGKKVNYYLLMVRKK